MDWILVTSIASSSAIIRHDGRQALGEHRLAGSRRAQHEQVVVSRGGDLEGALDVGLALDVGKVDRVAALLAEEGLAVELLGRDVVLPLEQGDRRAQVGDGVDVDPLDDGRLGGILRGNQDGLVARVARLQGQRQDALHRANPAVERQFADDGALLQRALLQFFAEGDHADGDRQVEAGPLLAQVGGGEVDGGVTVRPAEAAVADGGEHPIGRLAHRRVGQPDRDELRVAPRGVYLDLHRQGVDAVESAGVDSGVGHGKEGGRSRELGDLLNSRSSWGSGASPGRENFAC